MGLREKDRSAIKDAPFNGSNNNTEDYQHLAINEFGAIQLETEGEKRQRHGSLRIIYLTVFVQCLGASIVITGLWPFLQKLDAEANKEWLGGIVAANPLGQLIFSPLIGWWCNRVNSVGIPSVFCLLLFILSNSWYALLPLHRTNAKYYMFAARFLVGVSSGSITACRTFISQETLLKERTAAISHLSLCQSLGFILGPVAQVLLTKLGDPGYTIVGDLTLSMYTSAGWVACVVGMLNLILYLPTFFKESNIADREVRGKPGSKVLNWSEIPPDYVGITLLIVGFFVVFFSYSLLETLGTPVTIDQFGWSHAEAMRNVGIATSISSIISLACFFTIPALCKRLDERIILIGMGMGPTVLGRFFFFPFGGPVAPMRIESCVLDSVQLTNVTSKASCGLIQGAAWTVIQHGCPAEQAWCFEIPALNGIVLAVGYGICTIGYPYSVVLLQTMYSKMVGPRPQGVWMGALTGISSLARVVGPFFVTYIYTEYGTIATSAAAVAVMLAATLGLLAVYKRLVPIKIPHQTSDQSIIL